MSTAIRAITQIQNADDVNVTLGAGVDEYALCWDNDTAKFVLRAMAAGVTDHGLLDAASLLDDDHTQYLLATGARTGASAAAQTFNLADAVTNAVSDVVVVGHDTSGTAAAGFGVGVKYTLESNTTAAQDAAQIAAYWTTATHATRTSALSFALVNSAAALATKMTLLATGFVEITAGTNTLLLSGGTYPGLSCITGGTAKVSFLASGGSAFFDYSGTAASDTGNFYFRSKPNDDAYRVGWFDKDGRFIISTNAAETATTRLHVKLSSAVTNAVTDVVTFGHDTSGTAAAGFGVGQIFTLESSTTAKQSAARIVASWSDATHATRKADLVLSAYDTAEREGLRIRGNGSAAAIGFLGAAPSAQIAHVADAKVDYGAGDLDTEAEVITAINTANGKINSILATLEIFGLHAAA